LTSGANDSDRELLDDHNSPTTTTTITAADDIKEAPGIVTEENEDILNGFARGSITSTPANLP
jgi:hypothetical protein